MTPEEAEIVAKDLTADAVRAQQYRSWRRYPPGHVLHLDLNRAHSARIVARHREAISQGCLYLFEGRQVMT